MQVVGVTTQQEVYVVSKERKFRVNEILIIEDESLNYPRGEVVETLSYNRLIPDGDGQVPGGYTGDFLPGTDRLRYRSR